MTFAAKLRDSRVKAGLSLQKLAEKIGVSKAHIWDLETERSTNPSLEVLKKLSTVLDIPIAKLVDESSSQDEQAGELREDDQAVVMFRDLKQLNPEDRETIKIMMERLRGRKGST